MIEIKIFRSKFHPTYDISPGTSSVHVHHFDLDPRERGEEHRASSTVSFPLKRTRNSPFPLKLHEEQRPCKHITETTGDAVHTNGKVALRGVFSRGYVHPARFRFIVNFPWPTGNVPAVDETLESCGGYRKKGGRGGKKKEKNCFFSFKTCGPSA